MKIKYPSSLQILNEFGIFAALIGVTVDDSKTGFTQFTSDKYPEFCYSVCTNQNVNCGSDFENKIYKQAELPFSPLKDSYLIGMKKDIQYFKEKIYTNAEKLTPITALSQNIVIPRYTYKQWQTRIALSQNRKFSTICYVENNSCSGTISLFVGEENIGALFDIWVAEDQRNRGIGNIMLNAALNQLAAQSVKICVVQALKQSVSFYESNQFEYECLLTYS